MRMRARSLLAVVVAVIAVAGVAPAGASAQEFIYKVGGNKLEAGQSRETTGGGKNFILKGEASGTKTEVECEMALAAGSNIKGGTPGTSEDTINLSACKALLPSGCKKVTVKAVKAKNEIVLLLPSKKLGELFTPIGTEPLTEVTFEGCLSNVTVPVTGKIAAQESPEGKEETKGKLVFPTTVIKKVETLAKVVVGVKLEFGGSEGTLSGESSVELTTKEVFGIF